MHDYMHSHTITSGAHLHTGVPHIVERQYKRQHQQEVTTGQVDHQQVGGSAHGPGAAREKTEREGYGGE